MSLSDAISGNHLGDVAHATWAAQKRMAVAIIAISGNHLGDVAHATWAAQKRMAVAIIGHHPVEWLRGA